MTARRTMVAVVGAVVLLALLAGLGRWERERWISAQNEKIGEIVGLIGPNYLVRTITDFWDEREWRRVHCLRYWYGGDPYALQVCFDERGRLIEAYDERSGTIEIADLGAEPTAAKYGIEPWRLNKIRRLVAMRQLEMTYRENLRRGREAARRAAEAARRAQTDG